MSKSAVIYYSQTNNTKFIAEQIAKHTKSDLIQIERKGFYNSLGFFKYIIGAIQAIAKSTPPIKEISYNPLKYDLIYVGTPIWVGSINPAIRSFLKKYKIKKKKIMLFCSYGQSKENVFNDFTLLLKGNKILGELALKQSSKKDQAGAIKQIKKWVKR